MTGRFDEHPIKDRFSGVSFAFYTDEEIEKLSVQEIIDPVAFDHLNNPTKQGLHDKHLGVSPFDQKSTCPTCGMTVNYCPGHCGHINLSAPIYNPFLIKDIYKLLKSKCFACDRLRIHPSKIEVYVSVLKLLKAGDLVRSSELKSYFLYAAKEISLIGEASLTDHKKCQAFKTGMDKLAPLDLAKSLKRDIDKLDLPGFITKMENSINEMKEEHEEDLKKQLAEVIGGRGTALTSTGQKAILDLQKEMWSQVVTTTCPHCKHKSPSVKKDGYTKLFVKPLQAKIAAANRQSKNIAKAKRSKSQDEEAEEEKFEVITSASTQGDKSSRRPSGASSGLGTSIHSESESEEEYQEGGPQKFVTPIEVEDHLKRLWQKESKLLGLLYGKYDNSKEGQTDTHGVRQFFLRKVIVPPSRFRPESQGGLGGAQSGDKAYLHTHSAMLMKILQSNLNLSQALIDNQEGKSSNATQKWIQLQDAVNTFMDSSMAQKTSDRIQQGVRQLLERKEGMFRMKMMGKRVNFGGRSVISPDPNITTDQIGVPVFMARKLTFPESVSAINAGKLAKLVKNGANVHPGANMVEDEVTGVQTQLVNMTAEERQGIANQLRVGRKIVHRHLANGDPLLVNRQPTLHKPSIMAHIARILPKEQTLRMHYANCSTYNADFDGDEMNIHLPQSYQAVSEAYKLMATHKQYVVPTSGKPIRGLIQDSVVSGVFMSSKDCFLTKAEYMQLVYAGLRGLIEENKLGKIVTMPPTLIKPRILWTGKQVISTVLKNIVISGMTPKQIKESNKVCGLNLDSKSRLAAKEWGPLGKEEGEVIFRDNEHLQGTLDKNQFGSSDQGLVHSFYEIYGSEKAGVLLTSLARIFAVFLQENGFTVGLDDLMLKPEANKHRRQTIEKGHQDGVLTAAKFAEMSNFQIQKMNYSNRVVFQSKKNFDKDIEALTKSVIPEDPFDTNKVKKCIQADNPIRGRLEDKIGQSKDSREALEAEMDGLITGTMSQATSKVLKDCIPEGLVKRFPKNNISAMVLTGAKGGVVNQTQISALLGQQQLEGRRVPKMQNGKTLPCFLAYDPNPRSSGYVSDRFISGLRPQDFFFHCMAGREGLIDTAVKTSRSGYLQRCLIKQLESLCVSYDMTVRDNDGSIVQFMYGDDGIDVMETKFLDKFKFMDMNSQNCFKDSYRKILESGAVEIEPVKKARKEIKKESKAIAKDPSLAKKKVDPILSRFHPKRYFGSISEKTEASLEGYLKKDSLYKKINGAAVQVKHKYPVLDPEQFERMFFMKYLRSVVHAGENVGTVAAQSIGEPSTQMTLNTFHLAGHGAANMTLGIPRLKEILMTTPTNIKTPCMTVYFNKGNTLSSDQMHAFAQTFERLKLSDVVKEIKLTQSIDTHHGEISRIYRLTLEFEDSKQLEKKLGIRFNHLCKVFSEKFVPLLMTETLKDLRKAAELDVVHGENEASLRQQRIDTTKATKLARGTVVKGQDEIDETIEGQAEDALRSKKSRRSSDNEDTQARDSADEESVRDEDMADIDGVQRSKVVKYDDAESQSEHGSNDVVMSEHGDISEFGQEIETSQKLKEDLNQYRKINREKHAKYLKFLKGDFLFEVNKSATVTLSIPVEYKKLLLLTIAETMMNKVLVRNIPGIEKCTLVPPQKAGAEPYLFVQGINFQAFEKHCDVVDLQRIQTNHSYALKNRYGIEACRANIVKEIRSVFDVYGIAVDYRHLSLIGDFVTFNGDYRAFNRIGMEESSSPFLKMSFETTMKYLVQSSCARDTDWIKSPSSALVLGQVPQVGSNTFDLIQGYAC